MKKTSSLKVLNKKVVHCTLCPRLVNYRENVPARPPYEKEPHWRKPVPGFGDASAWLMILGLAPSPLGGNRTGRIFTGDKTGDFLIRALYRQGFANQPTSKSREDGLLLTGCYLTAAVKCVPPSHKPIPQEFLNCSRYWQNEMQLLPHLFGVLALGKFAFDVYIRYAKQKESLTKKHVFKHGEVYSFDSLPFLYASYHPSPQNTNTGVMTEKMFDLVLEKIKDHYKNREG